MVAHDGTDLRRLLRLQGIAAWIAAWIATLSDEGYTDKLLRFKRKRDLR